MAEKVVRWWLVVNADGDVRVRRSRPCLAYNEVVFPITLTIPLRRETAEEIRLRLPEMPVPEAEVGEVEEPEPMLGVNLATGQLVPPPGTAEIRDSQTGEVKARIENLGQPDG